MSNYYRVCREVWFLSSGGSERPALAPPPPSREGGQMACSGSLKKPSFPVQATFWGCPPSQLAIDLRRLGSIPFPTHLKHTRVKKILRPSLQVGPKNGSSESFTLRNAFTFSRPCWEGVLYLLMFASIELTFYLSKIVNITMS